MTRGYKLPKYVVEFSSKLSKISNFSWCTVVIGTERAGPGLLLGRSIEGLRDLCQMNDVKMSKKENPLVRSWAAHKISIA